MITEADMDETGGSRAKIQDYVRLLVKEHRPLQAFATYFGRGLIQHDPDIGDGDDGDEAFLQERQDADPETYLPTEQYATVVHNILADRDLVCMKSHVFTGREDAGRVFVDIWRVENGRFAEHWSAIEPISRGVAGSLPMWGGMGGTYEEAAAAGDTASAPVCGTPGDGSQRLPSLAVVRAWLDAIQDPAGIADAAERYIAEDFKDYSPRVAPGRKGLVDHLTAISGRGETFREARLLADGNFVLFHGRAMTPDHALGYSQMHLFRVADGKIAAHWGVRQAIPTYSVAGRSMVEGPLEEGRRKGKPDHPVKH